MADSSGCKTCSIANSNIQLSVKPSDICCICEELKSELHKAQLEILSYEKVIKCYVKNYVMWYFVPSQTPENKGIITLNKEVTIQRMIGNR